MNEKIMKAQKQNYKIVNKIYAKQPSLMWKVQFKTILSVKCITNGK